MARPLGSQNKDKPFRDALRMELAALGEDDPKSLRGLARKLLAAASDGENTLAAIKEVADRLDGKPAQALVGGDDDDPAIRFEKVVRTIVRPEHTDG